MSTPTSNLQEDSNDRNATFFKNWTFSGGSCGKSLCRTPMKKQHAKNVEGPAESLQTHAAIEGSFKPHNSSKVIQLRDDTCC
jgi:hypothetical protein